MVSGKFELLDGINVKKLFKIMLNHDLSGNEAKISFELLLQTTRIAVGYARVKVETELRVFQNNHFESNFSDMKFGASQLAIAAQNLKEASDTLYVLEESKTRETFTLIGKPKLTEE